MNTEKPRVLIYGAGSAGKRVVYSLDDAICEIVALIDSDSEKWGTAPYELYPQLKVIPPTGIVTINYDRLIISNDRFEKEIRETLKSLGVDDRKIALYQADEYGIKWVDERITVLRQIISTIKERNIPGDMAEVGVYQGDFAKYFNRYLPERKLYLFDTFEGFDLARDKVDTQHIPLFSDTSINLVLNKMLTPDNVIIKKGYFPDTTKGVDGQFCLVSLDCDLYAPILAGLKFFYSRLARGGYIFVHDLTSVCQGVKDAVFEWCDENAVPFVPLIDKYQSAIIGK